MKFATALLNIDACDPEPLGHQRNHPNSDWSPERTEALKVMFHQGLSMSEMGGALGVSRNAVVGRLHDSLAERVTAQWAVGEPIKGGTLTVWLTPWTRLSVAA